MPLVSQLKLNWFLRDRQTESERERVWERDFFYFFYFGGVVQSLAIPSWGPRVNHMLSTFIQQKHGLLSGSHDWLPRFARCLNSLNRTSPRRCRASQNTFLYQFHLSTLVVLIVKTILYIPIRGFWSRKAMLPNFTSLMKSIIFHITFQLFFSVQIHIFAKFHMYYTYNSSPIFPLICVFYRLPFLSSAYHWITYLHCNVCSHFFTEKVFQLHTKMPAS